MEGFGSPDPYMWLTDPGGLKTYGSGSTTLPLSLSLSHLCYIYYPPASAVRPAAGGWGGRKPRRLLAGSRRGGARHSGGRERHPPARGAAQAAHPRLGPRQGGAHGQAAPGGNAAALGGFPGPAPGASAQPQGHPGQEQAVRRKILSSLIICDKTNNNDVACFYVLFLLRHSCLFYICLVFAELKCRARVPPGLPRGRVPPSQPVQLAAHRPGQGPGTANACHVFR